VCHSVKAFVRVLVPCLCPATLRSALVLVPATLRSALVLRRAVLSGL